MSDQSTRHGMPQDYTISGALPRDLGNAVSDAMFAAMTKGMTLDEACCCVVTVAANYWRYAFGDNRLPTLASIVERQSGRPMPEVIPNE